MFLFISKNVGQIYLLYFVFITPEHVQIKQYMGGGGKKEHSCEFKAGFQLLLESLEMKWVISFFFIIISKNTDH